MSFFSYKGYYSELCSQRQFLTVKVPGNKCSLWYTISSSYPLTGQTMTKPYCSFSKTFKDSFMKDIIVVEKRIKEEQWVRLSAATSAGGSHIHRGCTWTPWTILLCLFLALKNTLTFTLLGKRKTARFKGTCPGIAVIGSRAFAMGALQMERRKRWPELEKNKGRVNAQIPIPVHQLVSWKQRWGTETTPLTELSGEGIFILAAPHS